MASRGIQRLVRQYVLWAAIGAGALFVVFLGFSTFRVYQKMEVAKIERMHAEKERDAIKTRTADMERSIASLATPRGVEAEIRARYPVVKKGEVEFVLMQDAAIPVDTSTTTRESIWGTVRNWLGW